MSFTPGNEWPCTETGYKRMELIGAGAFAKVYKARVLTGPHAGSDVAIKVIDLEQFPDSTMEEIRRELTTMKQCNHPNAINYNIAFIVRTSLWLVMNLLGGGSCLSVIRSVAPQGIKDNDILAYILGETLQVLKYCHENQLLHRDLKAGNILLGDEDARVVLADFGVAASLKDANTRTTFVGTPCWMAPEVLEQSAKGYDWRADMWSLGITAIELATGEAPFQRLHPLKVMMMVLQQEPQRLDTAQGWNASFAGVVNACLQKDPKLRPSAAALLTQYKSFFADRAAAGREKLLKLVARAVADRQKNGAVMGASAVGASMINNGMLKKDAGFEWDFGDDAEQAAADKDPLDDLGEMDC